LTAVPLVGGWAELVLKQPVTVPEFRERQPNVALALVGSVVHGHKKPLPLAPTPLPRRERGLPPALPGKSANAVAGPVALPGGDAFEQLPLAVAHWRSAEHG